MGYLPEPTSAMGEYSVEVRSESLYLYGESSVEHDFEWGDAPRHVLLVYETDGPTHTAHVGTVEILIEDIPKIRAALDQAERVVKGMNDDD